MPESVIVDDEKPRYPPGVGAGQGGDPLDRAARSGMSTLSLDDMLSDIDFSDIAPRAPVAAPPSTSADDHAARLEASFEEVSQVREVFDANRSLDNARAVLAAEAEFIEKLDAEDPEQAAARQKLLDSFFRLQRATQGLQEKTTEPGVAVGPRPPALAPTAAKEAAAKKDARSEGTGKGWRPTRTQKMVIAAGVLVVARVWLLFAVDLKGRERLPPIEVQRSATSVTKVDNRPRTKLAMAQMTPSIGVIALVQELGGLRAVAFATPTDPNGGQLSYRYTWMADGAQVHSDTLGVLPGAKLQPGRTYEVEVSVKDQKNHSASAMSEKLVYEGTKK